MEEVLFCCDLLISTATLRFCNSSEQFWSALNLMNVTISMTKRPEDLQIYVKAQKASIQYINFPITSELITGTSIGNVLEVDIFIQSDISPLYKVNVLYLIGY